MPEIIISIFGLSVQELKHLQMKKQILLFTIIAGILLFLPFTTIKADLYGSPFWQYQTPTYIPNSTSTAVFNPPLLSNTTLDKLNNNQQGLYAQLRKSNYQPTSYSPFDNSLPSDITYEDMYSDSRRSLQRAVGNNDIDTGTGGNKDNDGNRNDAPIGNSLILLLFSILYILFISLRRTTIQPKEDLVKAE